MLYLTKPVTRNPDEGYIVQRGANVKRLPPRVELTAETICDPEPASREWYLLCSCRDDRTDEE